jgi:G3E family GTPase
VKDDLINTLEQLTIHKDRFDYILIETTGMANPGPLISSLWTDTELGSYLELDGVICLVDAVNIIKNLGLSEVSYEVRQQLCFADRILINKVDLVSAEQVRILIYQFDYLVPLTRYRLHLMDFFVCSCNLWTRR